MYEKNHLEREIRACEEYQYVLLRLPFLILAHLDLDPLDPNIRTYLYTLSKNSDSSQNPIHRQKVSNYLYQKENQRRNYTNSC